MAGKKPGNAKAKGQKPEPSFQRWFFGHVFSLLRRHGNVIALWGGLGYIARELSLALVQFAGRTSSADLSLRLMANIKLCLDSKYNDDWLVNYFILKREGAAPENPRKACGTDYGTGTKA